MQIVDGEIDGAALANIGSEAARLLRSGEISTLAARFGYAVAFGREVEARNTGRFGGLLGPPWVARVLFRYRDRPGVQILSTE